MVFGEEWVRVRVIGYDDKDVNLCVCVCVLWGWGYMYRIFRLWEGFYILS